MADCGATGSAIDRTASRFLSSIQSSNDAATASTMRAGKAISHYVGGNMMKNGISSSAARPMMPMSAPTHLGPVPQKQNIQLVQKNETSLHQAWDSTSIPHQEQLHHVPAHSMIHNHPQYSMQQLHPSQANPMQQMHQMHMQMNMMQQQQQQQMAMMQMARQQQMQQQQLQLQKEREQEKIQESQKMQQKQQVEQTQKETEKVGSDWHESLEDEFRSYLKDYKNELANNENQAQNDAISTHENDDLGHEGFVEGASMDQLAAAWEEAEREFATDDYANLASWMYDDSTKTTKLSEVEIGSSHQHYEFSQDSRNYGQIDSNTSQQTGDRTQDNFVDLMEEGMKNYQEGNISEAILCFESELQNVDGDNADAWLMLGKCHAENDEDRKAIICLENAVERDPYASESLLTLGVSYVNELDHERAYKCLHNFVTHNPNYAGLTVGNEDIDTEGSLFKLKQLLHKAKALDEANGNVESAVDVLETLGVVCNVTREYEEAIECFRTATSMRPNDHQLWNKLGATLANSNRSEEAHEAYQKALSIKPKYARSWLNKAIAHSNLQHHEEAARCYLQTLSLNPGAVHVWSYLRIALTCCERWDLLPLAAEQNIDAFREHFDFVV